MSNTQYLKKEYLKEINLLSTQKCKFLYYFLHTNTHDNTNTKI